MINVEAKREATETTGSLLRRFSKKVSVSSILKTVKGRRARGRPLSHFKKKKAALHRLAKRAEIGRLKKLGKII